MPVTRADELDALAERVEKLTGPDREIDALVACATFITITTDDDLIYARQRNPGHDATHPGHYFIKSRSGASAQVAPSYTSSLDAAMSLVPEGLSWTLGQNVHHGYWQASINKLDDDGVPTSVGCSNATKMPYSALTCAALRAQASIIREAGR